MPQQNPILLRRGTAAQWASVNPVLDAGEPGLETDTGTLKHGDGVTHWLDLPPAQANIYAAIQNQAPGGSVVFFGDSVMDQSGTASFNDDATQGATALPMWICALTQGRLTPIRNAGVGGNTTAQMLARIQTDVLDYTPNLVVWATPGVNDVKGAVDPATTQANLTTMFDMLAKANIYVVVGTITPSNLIDTTAEKQALFTLNRWLVEQGRTRRGLTVVDVYSLVADRATVTWQTGWTADGTHQSPIGAWTIAKAFASAINTLIPAATSRLTRSAADPYELAPNATMTGNTGGVANSTTITGGTGTASKVARADGVPGEWQQYAQTSGTGFIFQSITLASAGIATGDKIVARFELDSSGVTATTHQLYVEWRDGSNAVVGAAPAINLLDNNSTPGDFSGVFEINASTAPATATTLRIGHKLVGAGTVKLGTMSARKKGT